MESGAGDARPLLYRPGGTLAGVRQRAVSGLELGGHRAAGGQGLHRKGVERRPVAVQRAP